MVAEERNWRSYVANEFNNEGGVAELLEETMLSVIKIAKRFIVWLQILDVLVSGEGCNEIITVAARI